MYQYALVTILHNQKENTWHPIYYYDSPVPGGFDSDSLNNSMMRYKSKGHHTSGFKDLEDAIKEAKDIEQKLIGMNDKVRIELETIIPWDGEGIPADVQFRDLPAELVKP